MSNLAVIYFGGPVLGLHEPLFQGPTVAQRIMKWAGTLPDVHRIVCLSTTGEKVPENLESIEREVWTEGDLLEVLEHLSSSTGGSGHLFYAWGDSPYLDGKISRDLWDLHSRYDAEYSFADGYPIGLAPEILSATLAPRLQPLCTDPNKPVVRDSLFEILRKDINAFDVETLLSPQDLRMDRVSLTCDSRRNLQIMERLVQAGPIDGAHVCETVKANRSVLRGLPAYFPIQITDRCPQACSYCPFAQNVDPRNGRGFMDLEVFSELCDRIAEFTGDGVISPSLWGEPALHPQIVPMIGHALSHDGFRVLIETSGIGWSEDQLNDLKELDAEKRLLWIVSLDAMDPDLYRELRGDGLQEAMATARSLGTLFGDRLWVQAVRMHHNDDHLEQFHKFWTEQGFQVIIQKYDAHAAFLEERQPADLSPLQRFPCWHLKRDMPILLDGRIPVCKDDLGRRPALGNVFEKSLADLWFAGDSLHKDHVEGRYPGPCADCDEYYAFNF